MVDLQAVLDRLGLVVVALDQPRAVLVADALVLRRVEVHVVEVAVLDADPPAGEPADHLLVGGVQQQRGGETAVALRQSPVEHVRLPARAREAVEDEAVGGLRGVDPLHDHVADQVVRHQVAAVHVLLGLAPQLGAVLHGGAQDVAGRVVGQVEVVDQALCLGALAGAGRSQQYQVQFGHGRRSSVSLTRPRGRN